MQIQIRHFKTKKALSLMVLLTCLLTPDHTSNIPLALLGRAKKIDVPLMRTSCQRTPCSSLRKCHMDDHLAMYAYGFVF